MVKSKKKASLIKYEEEDNQDNYIESDAESINKLAGLKTTEIEDKIFARSLYRWSVLLFLFVQLGLLTWLIHYTVQTKLITDIEIFLSTLLPSTMVQTYAILRIMINSDFKEIKY